MGDTRATILTIKTIADLVGYTVYFTSSLNASYITLIPMVPLKGKLKTIEFVWFDER